MTDKTDNLSEGATFFCGIGGSGMSSLAQVLASRGQTVHGSDRSHDRGESAALYGKLSNLGITLFPQDSSGIGSHVRELIVSTAVEDAIPDVGEAKRRGIPIRRRAELLASLFNGRSGIAVGGSSGKSTVTGMVATILRGAGGNPTVINAGIMLDAVTDRLLGNAIPGDPDAVVIESDESDGSIALYESGVAVVTNISLDHKSIEELTDLFTGFCRKADRAVVNLDSGPAAGLKDVNANTLTFSMAGCSTGSGQGEGADLVAEGIQLGPTGSHFQAGGHEFVLNVPGAHNVSNALAAIGAAVQAGLTISDMVEPLSSFRGIQRRLQVLGEAGGVTVFDDFAHNPEKIAASLATLRMIPGRLLVVFQPHGFAPTRLTKDGLISAFSVGLGPDDLLIMPEIYFAGGTAVKDISSKDLTDGVVASGRKSAFIPDREAIAERLLDDTRPGDRIVIMGARDDTLTEFGLDLLHRLGKERNTDGHR